MDQNKQDGLIWVNNKDNLFFVNTCYKLLQNLSGQGVPNWPWKSIRRTKAPVKVAYFGWIVTREARLTQNNLQKMSFALSSIGV